MATIHRHRPATPGYVRLDFEVPTSLLSGDDLAPLRDLHAAFLDAQGEVEAAHDALAEAKEAKSIRDAAIRQAIRNGEKAPAAVSEAEAEALTEVATATLNAALRTAHNAARAYEAGLLEHRDTLRKALRPTFLEADAKATEAARIKAEADARRGSVLSALNTLDAAAAERDKAASGERTHRFANALTAARSRLGETAAVETDLLQSEEYRLAHAGEAVVRQVQGLTHRLAAIRAGDVTFTSLQDRVREEARIQDALNNLRAQP